MPDIRLAAAQSISAPGDLLANIDTHLRFVAAAHRHGVDFMLFPELSLSGYELELLQQCQLREDDARLDSLREAAVKAEMTLVLGAPVAAHTGQGLAIGAISLFADGSLNTYRKQHLHPGEQPYLLPGDSPSRLQRLQGETIALAICADTNQPQHPAQASQAGATLYAASMLLSAGGYAQDAATLQGHAHQQRMGVLMANHGGPSGGYAAAGRSAFWTADGQLLLATPGTGQQLLLVTSQAGSWRGECQRL